ncbi:MAG: ABC transporter ATP-binding protein [Leptospiraceae bacterium]|nr:ABC transporter ATP-binding protein [Leptospiraceae bacterium]
MSIVVENVSKSFGDPPTEVIRHVDFTIGDGEFVSLTGKSGSGKSTLLYIVSSLDSPTSGRVLIEDRDVVSLTSRELHEFRNRYMGFVFQFHYLLPEFTALENVLMPARKAGNLAEKKPYAEYLLEKFDLKDKMQNLPGQLSGGQAQRVALARALIMQPKYLFADEPTGSLDSTNARIVMDIFRKINAEEKCTIIYVTHDADFARLAKRSIHLLDGTLVKGEPKVARRATKA